jgi:hypothetical protein
MGESRVWGISQFMAFLAVLALHAVMLAILVMTSRTSEFLAPQTQSIELMYLASSRVPGVRVDGALPQRSSADNAIALTSPVLTLPPLPAEASSTNNVSPGIDWDAEAHRAAEAAAKGSAGSASDKDRSALLSAGAGWWRQPQHHAGDQFKTDTGDWIVWTSSKCFVVANALLRVLTTGAALAVTQCPGDSGSPRGDLFAQLAAYKKLHPTE